jgi:FtsP/CotA-like multicopper oxidase with cupredoxin domain
VLTRRRVIAGALGAAGAASLSAGLTRLDNIQMVAQGEEIDPVQFVEPPVCRSVDGVLETILIAQESPSNVADSTMNFNGVVPGPTLRLAQGERLRIKLVNRLPPLADPMDTSMRNNTNLHVHGLHVSPLGHGDDVLRVNLAPGEQRVYEFDIRPDHQAGTFWYHPHHHGNVERQVRAGMAGAIIIEGDLDELPQTKGVPEHLLVLQGNFTPDTAFTFLVNGQRNPTIRMTLGERRRFRILNASYRNFYNLALKDPVSETILPMQRISADGNYLRRLVPTERLLLGPAERAEVLIEPDEAKTLHLVSLAWDGPPAQDEIELATLVVEPAAAMEAAVASPVPLSRELVGADRLPDRRASADPLPRILTFVGTSEMIHEDMGEPREFNANHVDQWVKLGDTERWIIRNQFSPIRNFWHPFHLHVNDLQVVRTTDQEQLEPYVFYKDTVPTPPGGEVELLIPFIDFTGRFVYHCHILAHEDDGMMGIVEVMQPIDMIDSAYSPVSVEVTLNTTVQWTNQDDYAHTVTADDGSFVSGPLYQGDEYRHAFETPGTYPYHCDFHPKMRGTIVVPEVVAPVEPLEVPIDISGSAFAPMEVSIAACQTVIWTNRDGRFHLIADENGAFISGELNFGEVYYRTFYVPGRYTFRLDGNPDLLGIVEVT